MAARTHTGVKFNSVGTVLRMRRVSLPGTRIVTASARAIPPGQSRRWVYMASGPFEGFWVRPGDGIQLVP